MRRRFAYDPTDHASPEGWREQLAQSPVRVQWDPERDLRLVELPHRSLQLGLSGPAVEAYVDVWTVRIEDVTPLAHEIYALLKAGEHEPAASLRPAERAYPLTA